MEAVVRYSAILSGHGLLIAAVTATQLPQHRFTVKGGWSTLSALQLHRFTRLVSTSLRLRFIATGDVAGPRSSHHESPQSLETVRHCWEVVPDHCHVVICPSLFHSWADAMIRHPMLHPLPISCPIVCCALLRSRALIASQSLALLLILSRSLTSVTLGSTRKQPRPCCHCSFDAHWCGV